MIGKVTLVDRCGIVTVCEKPDGRWAVFGSKLVSEVGVVKRHYGTYKTEPLARWRRLQVIGSSKPKKIERSGGPK